MSTPLPSPKSTLNCKPMTVEDVKDVVQKKGMAPKVGINKKLTQNVNEFLQEIVSSSNKHFEGLISLRMANTSKDNGFGTSRDGKRLYHDTMTLIGMIQESYQKLDAEFVNKSSKNFDSYLNGISFTIFVKSFILIFDHGRRVHAREFFNKNVKRFKELLSTSGKLVDVKPVIENGCPRTKSTNQTVIERQRLMIESMESSLASNLLDSSLVSFNRSKIFIPLPSDLKQDIISFLEHSKDQILNRLFNESIILVEIQNRSEKSIPSYQSSSSSSECSRKRRKTKDSLSAKESLSAKDDFLSAAPSAEVAEDPLKKKIKTEPGLEEEEEEECPSFAGHQKMVSVSSIKTEPSLIPPPSVSVCVCTIDSTSCTMERVPKTSHGMERATCAAFSGDKSLIAAGFETSNCIKIFPMKAASKYQHLRERKDWKYRKASKSHLCLDIDVEAIKSCFDDDDVGGDDISNSSEECGADGTDKNIILRGHSRAITDLTFVKNFGAKNSNFLLSASKDSTVRLWNVSKSVASEALYSTGDLYNHSIWSIDSDSLGVYFASGSSDTIGKLWSMERTSGPLRLFVGHKLDINCIKFHQNCKYVATGSSDATIKLWSISDAKCVRSMSTNVSSNVSKSCPHLFFNPIITSICFAPNGHQLASAGSDGAIKLWDLRMSSRVLKLYKSSNFGVQSSVAKDSDQFINHVTFNSDGSLISSTTIDGSIKIWAVDGFNDEVSSVSVGNQIDHLTDQQQQQQQLICSTPMTSLNVTKPGVSLLSSSFVKSSPSSSPNLLIAFASSSLST